MILGIIFILALIVSIVRRCILPGILVFSILGNIVVWLSLGSRLYTFYEIEYVRDITRFFWPILNIFLLGGWFYWRKKR